MNPRLRLQQGKPEIAVTCNVTRLDTNQKVEMKKVTVTKRIRTDCVYNAKTKKYEDKAVYGPVEEIQNSVVVTGDIISQGVSEWRRRAVVGRCGTAA